MHIGDLIYITTLGAYGVVVGPYSWAVQCCPAMVEGEIMIVHIDNIESQNMTVPNVVSTLAVLAGHCNKVA